MSLLGIDVGTTGCKTACFSEDGRLLAGAYREYAMRYPMPGWVELDAAEVWGQIQETIREVTQRVDSAGIRALSISSLGEAVVPVTRDRRILGPSILNFDVRGAAYVDRLGAVLDNERLYALNGNTLGNHYGLTKLLWIQDYRPDLYERADLFLLWGPFVAFMLGAEPVIDPSLANRTLLFDLETQTWSRELLDLTGLDGSKLPAIAPSGTVIGAVAPSVAAALGLPPDVAITVGAHDQCANAVGCGVVAPGQAVYGIGTFICITPVFTARRDPAAMMVQGLNTEHHAVPGKYVTFIYNQGGSLVKWFRDTFAAEEHRRALAAGRDIYDVLLGEMPAGPTGLLALPAFTTTGPPDFIADAAGAIAGLRLETPRGAILKALIEGATFYLRAGIADLAGTDTQMDIREFRAVGGGSKSDAWIQLSADILGRPMVRPAITEAGALGAAIIAGTGCGAFASFEEGIAAMVRTEQVFAPHPQRHAAYAPWFERYQQLWSLMPPYLRELPVTGGEAS